jgi:hypothetical protein
MAGADGPMNVTAYGDRFSVKDVMAELQYMGVVAGVDDGEPVRSRSKAPTVRRRVLFLDGEFAGERHTVDVGADGVFAGRFVKSTGQSSQASVYYNVEYRVEEVRLGFGDTVFLGFTPASERPSWPQRVADALAFIEAESEAEAERERLLAEEKAEAVRNLERQIAALPYRDRERYCRHPRPVKLSHATPEDPHRYRTVCKDCDWSVLFEGPDTCSFCRHEPIPMPHPDRPDTSWMFCEHCGDQHEVNRKHTT